MVVIKGRDQKAVKEEEKYKTLREITARVIKESRLEHKIEIDDFLSPLSLAISKKDEDDYEKKIVVYLMFDENSVETTDPGLNGLALRLAEAYEEIYGKDTFTLKGHYQED